jgi:hypothetical protein
MAYEMLISENSNGLTVHSEIYDDGSYFVFRDKNKHAKVKWPESEVRDLIQFLKYICPEEDATQ